MKKTKKVKKAKKARKAEASASPHQTRSLDHVVMPVEEIELARSRLAALGFKLAETARHPFGTENANIHFRDGTFLEPLAIAQRETCEEAARAGNAFVAHDQAWRFRNGVTGFSAIAFTSDDTRADQKRFKQLGISAGNRLRFKRRAGAAKGAPKLSFALAFASDMRAPDLMLFTCQARHDPANLPKPVTRHANGVAAIRQVVLHDANPSDFQYFLQDVMEQRDQNAHSFGLDIEAANCRLTLLNDAGLQAWFGLEAEPRKRGLEVKGLVLATTRLDQLSELFNRNGIEWRERHGRIIVDAAPGQGAFFAFEAK